MKQIYILFIFLIFSACGQAQVGINTSSPDPNSILDLRSTNKGLLIPRLTTVQREAMSSGTFAQGMTVYDTDLDVMFLGYGAGSASTKWFALNAWETEYRTNNNSSAADMTTMTAAGITHGNVGIGVSVPTQKLHVDGKVKATEFIGYGAIPIGGIIMWSGSTVPDGWTLCNGVINNGITPPNLSGRFVVGIGSNGTTSYSHADKGGLDAVTLSTNQMPQHNHTFSGTTSSNGSHSHQFQQGYNDGLRGASSYRTGNPYHKQSIQYTSTAPNHNHNFSGTTSLNGSSTAHENRPAYYAIAYIMRVK